MILLFTIDHQRIDTSNTRYVVTDSREYLRAKFIFTPDWDGCEKTAIFSGTEKAYEVLLTGDECTVPHEVLGGRFGVSVFGINGDMRITTDTAYITAHQSGFAEGETPSDPTPTVYEQLLGKINVVADTANAELAEHEAGFNHPDGCVTTEKIADYSITTVKIAQGAVNNNRIMNGAVNARQGHIGTGHRIHGAHHIPLDTGHFHQARHRVTHQAQQIAEGHGRSGSAGGRAASF